jgi:hypothetical protein
MTSLVGAGANQLPLSVTSYEELALEVYSLDALFTDEIYSLIMYHVRCAFHHAALSYP